MTPRPRSIGATADQRVQFNISGILGRYSASADGFRVLKNRVVRCVMHALNRDQQHVLGWTDVRFILLNRLITDEQLVA